MVSEMPIGVTEKQRDNGLKAAEDDVDHAPTATNAFVTQSKMVSGLPLGVTEKQHDGLKAAEDDVDHAPSVYQRLRDAEQDGV